VTVGTPSAIQSILKKSESSQRVLEDATESFTMQILREDESGDEALTVEKLTADASPVIRLVTRRSTVRSSGVRATSISRRRTMRCT
jgi:type IV pilus assembly protein PilB